MCVPRKSGLQIELALSVESIKDVGPRLTPPCVSTSPSHTVETALNLVFEFPATPSLHPLLHLHAYAFIPIGAWPKLKVSASSLSIILACCAIEICTAPWPVQCPAYPRTFQFEEDMPGPMGTA
jgi:hypothetical protein